MRGECWKRRAAKAAVKTPVKRSVRLPVKTAGEEKTQRSTCAARDDNRGGDEEQNGSMKPKGGRRRCVGATSMRWKERGQLAWRTKRNMNLYFFCFKRVSHGDVESCPEVRVAICTVPGTVPVPIFKPTCKDSVWG